MSSAPLGQILLFVLISVQFAAQSPVYRRQAQESIIDNSSLQTRIDECKKSSYMACTSLKEALLSQYDISQGGLLLDTPQYVFSMFDLFYSDILRGENAPTPTSIHTTTAEFNRLASNRCGALGDLIVKGNSDTCQWKLKCKYNSSYFPSFLIQAELDKEKSLAEDCTSLRARNLKFVKITCESNKNEPHWCPCEGNRTITGYT